MAQSQALVLKIHGDYVDARIRNTSAELDAYEPELDALLDRILDEFGLVVCGWSAHWDPALRRALERSSSRRFTWYWARRGPLDSEAESLIAARAAVPLDIESADDFFAKLENSVRALDRIQRVAPIAATAVAAEVKNEIAKGDRIGLHDTLTGVQEELVRRMSVSGYDLWREYSEEELLRSVEQYEADAEIAVAASVAGCRWSKGESALWVRLIERIGNLSLGTGSTREVWAHLARYPAMQVLYAAGTAATAGEDWRLLADLLVLPVEYDLSDRRFPLAIHLDASNVLKKDLAQKLPALTNHKTPLNQRLFEVLREPLRGVFPADRDYDAAFDLFEYLFITTSYHLRTEIGRGGWIAPARLLWKDDYGMGNGILARLNPETGSEGRRQPLLDAGFFGGSVEAWTSAHVAAVEMAKHYGF